MKNLLLAFIAILLISCSGGWGDEDIQSFKEGAPRGMNAEMVECFLNAAQEKYSSYEEFETAMKGEDETVGKWMEELYKNCGEN